MLTKEACMHGFSCVCLLVVTMYFLILGGCLYFQEHYHFAAPVPVQTRKL